jgi:hypothetical protein
MNSFLSRNRKIPQIFAAVAGALLFFSAGRAALAQSISMSYVTVGDPGNAADSATGSLYGSVSYTYDIGEYDVTDSQYCTFLNDVDPTGANTLALYSPHGDAEYGITLNSGAASGSKYSVINGYANMPVVDVDYWSTLRFVNWMNNGEGNASTETGAYTLTGGSTDGHGTPSNASSLLANPQHNAGATVWLPSENEWYKAAYYDPTNKHLFDVRDAEQYGARKHHRQWVGRGELFNRKRLVSDANQQLQFEPELPDGGGIVHRLEELLRDL